MKKAKQAASDDRKGKKADKAIKKAKPAVTKMDATVNPEPNPSHDGLRSDLEMIKGFMEEVKNQGKLLKKIRIELKAIGARVGAK